MGRFAVSWTFVVAALCVFAYVASAGAARAYDDEGHVFCKWPYSGGGSLLTVKYRNDPDFPPSGAYATAFNSARSDWNYTPTPVWFTYTSYWLDQHYFAALPLGVNGPLGSTSDTCSWPGNQRIATASELNTSRLDSKSTNYKQSVASHELGHFIGIRHSYINPSVMNESRNRESIYEAMYDDECGVNDRYPSTSWPVTCTW